jgi:general secretion pathway protein K
MTSARDGQRGFVLLAVLWAMVLLALLFGQVVSAARSTSAEASALRGAAGVAAAADAALQTTVFDLLRDRVAADGAVRLLRIGPVAAEVIVTDEAGKLNPNTASPELLAAFLRAAGLGQGPAARLTDALLDWRGGGDRSGAIGGKQTAYRLADRAFGPPGAPFRSLGELGLVLGITPALLSALAPHLSLYQDGILDPAVADPLVRAAFAGARLVPPPAEGVLRGGARTVSVAVLARGPDGARARLRAVVRIEAGDAKAPVQVLDRREGDE